MEEDLTHISIRTVLPLRAGRRTHSDRPTHPNPPNIQHNNPTNRPLPSRRLPIFPLRAEYILAPRLRQQPPAFPHRQALRPTLHPLLRPRGPKPLALVPTLLKAPANTWQQHLAPAIHASRQRREHADLHRGSVVFRAVRVVGSVCAVC